ncbi:hypothetical protein BC628DRAFT_1314788 [Trametes gibbosa]|nr:hypothetical protein BC628DRAFT_1314788 [Trametes gibbosa]
MARGNGRNRGRGGRPGFSPEQSRGRGRGSSRGNGRGRGRGRGRGGPLYIAMDDFDYPIQQWPSNDPPSIDGLRGAGNFRGRGRGRGASFFSANGATPPQRGAFILRGSGRGRGDDVYDNRSRAYRNARGSASKFDASAPLSKQLYESNKFLKPIKFVRSVHTATLFTQQEDILQPLVEAAVEGDEKSHVPTADTVSRVFNILPEQNGKNLADEEELEEIDFADIGKLQAKVDAAAAVRSAPKVADKTTVQEGTAYFVDTTPTSMAWDTRAHRIEVDRLHGTLGTGDDEDDVIVYVAPHPRIERSTVVRQDPIDHTAPALSRSIITGLNIGAAAPITSASLAELEPEVAVNTPPATVTLSLETLYPESATLLPEASPSEVAPDAAELPPPPSFNSFSFTFEDQKTVKKQTRRLYQVGTPRSLLKRSRKARKKPLRGFGAYGAMHEEALLHEVDPRRDEQRRGDDSDVNWGDTDSEDGIEQLSTGMGDMEIDEGISLAAMKGFVHGMSAEGSRHVTMDDVADLERMRQEDEEEQTRGAESADGAEEDGDINEGPAASDDDKDCSESESSGENKDVEAVVQAEEAELIGEDKDDAPGYARRGVSSRLNPTIEGGSAQDIEEDGEEEESSDDYETTPKSGSQARLERLRASPSEVKGKGKGKARDTDSDDCSDEAMSIQMTWADEDETYLDTIQALLEENQHILNSRDRKSKKQLFAAIRDGNFDMIANAMSPAKRGKDKDVPPELREQWEKDRAKKAENKRKRALERLQLAADPLAQHKGGKKGRKAMLAAARAADDANLPDRIVDFVSLEQQIRRFLADIGGSNTMSLPPADKETRKLVHELAEAFNLKSQSKGSGSTRYTTLLKTSKSGLAINEKKIRRILKQTTSGAWVGPDGGRSAGRSKPTSLAHHREGEVVGKEAPRIGASNQGFKMLAAMGWNDGDSIGLSGGLEVPLTAIMKKTKLGLGASAQV